MHSDILDELYRQYYGAALLYVLSLCRDRALAEEFARLSGYALEEVPEESSYAGYKDWFIQSFRRPGFTIEVGSGINPLPLSQFDEIYRDNLGILTTAALGLRGS